MVRRGGGRTLDAGLARTVVLGRRAPAHAARGKTINGEPSHTGPPSLRDCGSEDRTFRRIGVQVTGVPLCAPGTPQRAALANFAGAPDFEIVAELVEVETGKGADALDRRPQLAAALASARRHRCSVAVAKRPTPGCASASGDISSHRRRRQAAARLRPKGVIDCTETPRCGS